MIRSHIVNKKQQIPGSIPGHYITATINKEYTSSGININKECHSSVSNTVGNDGLSPAQDGWNYLPGLECQGPSSLLVTVGWTTGREGEREGKGQRTSLNVTDPK